MANLLYGLSFTMTGEFDSVSKDSLEKLLRELGGNVGTGVTRKTTHVVYGSKLLDGRPVESTKKYQDGQRLGVPLFNES
jgi:NAD-dependent DNA ligase